MDLKQMTAFSEVMLSGSVSAAARNIGRSQPAVSHLIVKLEDEIGMPLFERRGARLHPVPEAAYLFRQCSDVLQRVKDIEATMQRMRDVEDGELRVVSMPGPTVEFLPMLVAKHFGHSSKVQVTMFSRSSDAVHRLMDAQQFDLGIADTTSATSTAQEASRRTFLFRSVCAVHAAHPLAKKDVITVRDLANEPIASLLPEHRSTKDLSAAFADQEMTPNYRFVGQFFLPLLNYVRMGLAIAVVDPIAQESWVRSQVNNEDIRFLPFEPKLDFNVDLLTPSIRTSSKLAKHFEACLTAELEDLQNRAMR